MWRWQRNYIVVLQRIRDKWNDEIKGGFAVPPQKRSDEMTLTNDDLMAISQLLDVKMETAWEPVKDEIDDLKQYTVHMSDQIQGVKQQNTRMEAEFQGLKQHIETVTDKNVSRLTEEELPQIKTELQGLKQHVLHTEKKLPVIEHKIHILNQHVEKLPTMEEEIHALNQHVEKLPTMEEEIRALNQHVEKLPTMEEEIRALNQHVEKLPSMEHEICALREEIHDLKLHIENETDKNIRLLAENYVPAAKRYEAVIPKLEIIESDIDIMKKVITEHSKKLRALA